MSILAQKGLLIDYGLVCKQCDHPSCLLLQADYLNSRAATSGLPLMILEKSCASKHACLELRTLGSARLKTSFS
jgi:hypothetical protein